MAATGHVVRNIYVTMTRHEACDVLCQHFARRLAERLEQRPLDNLGEQFERIRDLTARAYAKDLVKLPGF